MGKYRLIFKKSVARDLRGICRVVYEIRDDVLLVVVVRVGHRRDVYRDSGRK